MDAERVTFASLKAGLDARAAGRIVAACAEAFPTGFPSLDQALAGGLPRGTIGTLEGAPSSGRMALLAGVLAQATARGLAAVVDDGSLYPPDLERSGVVLERVLVVRAQKPAAIARCADILLRSRAFAAVAMPAAQLRATVWSRLCGLAQKAGTIVLAIGCFAGTELAYFASTRVRCAIERVLWSGGTGVLGELAGYDVTAHVLKHRRASPGAIARMRIVAQCGGASLRERAAVAADRRLHAAGAAG